MVNAARELSDSAAEVLCLLIHGDRFSRPELTSLLEVTPPTVSSALNELIENGFVAQVGSRQGKLGRAAALYALSARAGWLLGIDVGSTQILIVARSVDGALLSDFRYSAEEDNAIGAPQRSLTAVAFERVTQLVADLTPSHGKLLAATIALAHVVPNSTSNESVIGLGDEAVRLGDILGGLGLPQGVPVLLENNVNCAALAELSLGIAQYTNNFVYLQIGVHLGAGLVVDGKLRRGAHGASGELSELPFPMMPESVARSFQLEKHLSSEGLLDRTRRRWTRTDGLVPTTPKELFDMSDRDSTASVKAVSRYAGDIARLAMLLTAVVDPELIVLGGGIGQNATLARMVRGLLHEKHPEVRLDISALGERATVEGATALAIEFARTSLLGDRYPTILSVERQIVVSGPLLAMQS